MAKWSLGPIVLLTLSITPTCAMAVDQTMLDRLDEYAKEACLIGTQFDFHADANGDVTFRNLLKPGAEGKVDTNVRNSPGASAIFDQQLRVTADRQIQECMKPYIDKIFSAILDPSVSSSSNLPPAAASPSAPHRADKESPHNSTTGYSCSSKDGQDYSQQACEQLGAYRGTIGDLTERAGASGITIDVSSTKHQDGIFSGTSSTYSATFDAHWVGLNKPDTVIAISEQEAGKPWQAAQAFVAHLQNLNIDAQ